MNEQSSLEAIFFAALEKGSAQERAAYLDEACAGDSELRRRVEKMLAAQAHAGSFLESPPSGVASGASPTIDEPRITEGPGTVIGPYKLLQQIGEGGMGTVFMAEQTHPVQRKVALKVIKPGMDSRQVIARFEAERQALAMMDHVNIARVIDAGTTGEKGVGNLLPERPEGCFAQKIPDPFFPSAGRPYFVMELVHGVPITKYCDDNHLTPRERLELFVPVCQAIQHAHQKGIIHRDIKPSNVMVTLYDGKPVPKVIDFGVAKATEQRLTERTLFTQYGTMVGTLEYMSPEQAEMSALGVDTRSDIYSLGVLLYELLTGSTPLDHKRMKEAAYAEILRMIKEEEPPKPSTRLSDSGEALASISAQRHMEPAKLAKLVRGELDWIVMKTLEKDRNRRYETANGFAADVQRYLNDETVQACPPSALYRFRKFARRNKRALAATAVLGVALLVAVGAVAGSLGWVSRDRTARQTAVELEVNLALKEAERWQEQAKWPEALSAAKRAEGLLAGSGSGELRDRVLQLRKDIEMVLRLEEIPLLSSEWKDDKFDYERADRAYAQAFGEYGIDVAVLPVEEAAARIRARTGAAVALAAALDDWAFRHRRTKGEAGRLALTAVAQAADPNLWRRQVRQAVQQKDTKALAALAASHELLNQPPSSLRFLARALLVRGLAEAQVEVLRQAQRQYPGDFWINYELAKTLRAMGPTYRDEAVSFLRAALAVRPQSNAAQLELGNALKDQGKLDEAIAAYRKAIELDPKFAFAHANLGSALQDQGKLDEAIACYHRAIEIDPESAMAHNNLGGFLCDVKRDYDGAITCFRKAIELKPKDAFAHNNLGNALGHKGQHDDAIASFRRAIELDPKYSNPYYGLGMALESQGKLDDAIAAFRMVIELDPKYAFAHNNLGVALNSQGKVDEAIAAYRKAIEIKPKYAEAHNNLGVALNSQGKVDEAIAAYHKAIEHDPKLRNAHNNLGNALIRQGKLDEAIASYRRAIELDPKFAFAHNNLGNALKSQGKVDEAIAAYRTAIELDPKYANAHANLGTALYALQKWDDAIAAFRMVIEVDPKFAFAHNKLGNALQAQGKLDEAIVCYRRAIELDPKLRNAHMILGNALKSQGKVDEAIAAYRTAIEIDPKLVNAHFDLGTALYALQKWDDAIAAFRMVIELDPKYANAHNNLGVALNAQGKLDDAIAAYRKAIELDPKSANAHNNLGALLCDDLKDYDQAIECFRKAIELDPKDATAHNNLGNALGHKGQHDEAIASWRRAIELDPKYANYYSLGLTLNLQGKVDEAIAYYRTAIEIDPKLVNAHFDLGNALDAQGKVDEAIACFRKVIDLDPKFANAHYGLGNELKKQGKLDEAIASYRRAIELDPKYANAHYGLGNAFFEKGAVDDAIAAFREAIRFKVDSADVRNFIALRLNSRAWGLATIADASLRDGKRAVELAKEAVELQPQAGIYWNTLGAAHYRAESWKDAVAALEKSMELRQGGDSNDWFFLAIAHWQLGNTEAARKWYDQAVVWMDKNQAQNQELRRFRAEAADLLGVKEKKD